MDYEEEIQLRKAYADICNGFSITKLGQQAYYIKHINIIDQIELDELRQKFFADAKKRGIKTEKEILENLQKKQLWTQKQINELAQEENYLKNLAKTKSKLALKTQIEQIEKQMAESFAKVRKMISIRQSLIGKTAEAVAEDKTQYEYIRMFFYLDKNLLQRAFSNEDVYDWTEKEASAYLNEYVKTLNLFDVNKIKKISLQPFFSNLFYLCGDKIVDFFGKPIYQLTVYQSNLLSYGQYYKNIIIHNDIPDELMNDPDKIEDFVVRSKNTKNLVEKTAQKGGRVGLVGAKQEDFEALGVQDNTDMMRQAANKQYTTGRDAAKDLGFTYIN